MLGKSKWQESEATGHVVFRVRSQRVMNACCCSAPRFCLSSVCPESSAGHGPYGKQVFPPQLTIT